MFAAFGVDWFKENDKAHFGSIPLAMVSIWQIETLDAWEEIMYTNMFGCDQFGYVDFESTALNTTQTRSEASWRVRRRGVRLWKPRMYPRRSDLGR